MLTSSAVKKNIFYLSHFIVVCSVIIIYFINIVGDQVHPDVLGISTFQFETSSSMQQENEWIIQPSPISIPNVIEVPPFTDYELPKTGVSATTYSLLALSCFLIFDGFLIYRSKPYSKIKKKKTQQYLFNSHISS